MKLTPNSKLSYTPKYMTVDGKPWFPVMGEMHYSRVNVDTWEDELAKIKAGGVDIVSCYSIWIHHEEEEGKYDFSGEKDLHKFLTLVKKSGLYCWLRIGPWAHGEARNGGFPDWLLAKENTEGIKTRTDDAGYLAYVRDFYEHIYEQAKGLFLKDGGPIIGIQIENEYGHVGGQIGEAGEQHMRTLQTMAKEIGFDVPVWTATGWGGAVTGGMLPVMGGYCEAPWDPRTVEIEPSVNYVFTDERNDHGIASDYGFGEGVTFSYEDFPYLTAELGGGLQVTHHRRCIASGKDTAVMSMVKLGSGCNLLGYYMYHGGTNPMSELTTLQESTATGYPNDLPIRSYDFNAPIREFGQTSDAYRRIRMLSMFVHDYNDEICTAAYVAQPGNPEDPENLSDVRSAVRVNPETGCGFYFVNNYQRRYEMAAHEDAKLVAYGADGAVLADFGTRTIQDGDSFFYAFGLPLRNRAAGDQDQSTAVLRTTKCTPLCILESPADPATGRMAETTYVFYTDGNRGIVNPADLFTLEGSPVGVRILTLTEEEALTACKITRDGRDYLLLSDGEFLEEDGRLYLQNLVETTGVAHFRSYPSLPEKPAGFTEGMDGQFTVYGSEKVYKNTATCKAAVQLPAQLTTGGNMQISVKVEDLDPEAVETFLYIDYTGDSAGLRQTMNNGHMVVPVDDSRNDLIDDNFYTGQTWEVGVLNVIGRYVRRGITGGHVTAEDVTMELVVVPLHEEDKVYLQERPAFHDGIACSLDDLSVKAMYRAKIW